MKRTLKRELKVLEIVKREAIEFSISQRTKSIRVSLYWDSLYLMKYHCGVSRGFFARFKAQRFTALKPWPKNLATWSTIYESGSSALLFGRRALRVV